MTVELVKPKSDIVAFDIAGDPPVGTHTFAANPPHERNIRLHCTRKQAQKIADSLAEQGIRATLPEMVSLETLKKAKESIKAVSRFARTVARVSDTQGIGPEAGSSLETCGECRYFANAPRSDPGHGISGTCRWRPAMVEKGFVEWCGQFKRGKEGSKE